MSLPKPTKRSTVVITGASSGIGTELAKGLAQRGFPLMLVARRRERLDELADQLRDRDKIDVEVLPLDLSVADSRAQLAQRLSTDPIAGLCNSAGFGTSGRFCELPPERESEEVTLNALALMELTRAVLPGMVKRGEGAVLNIASIAGFQPLPFMALYSATKAFVLTFSEAVQEELHGTGVSVTALCPGPVPTEWAEIASAERFSVPLAQGCPRSRSPNRPSRACCPESGAWYRVWCPRSPAPPAGCYRAACCCRRSGSETNCAAAPTTDITCRARSPALGPVA